MNNTEVSRRELLGSGALALTTGVHAQRPPRKIRIGVVGGNFGTSFYWHEHPDCVVQVVSDLIPERRKRLKQVYRCDRAYESLEKLILDKEVDAVAVFTPAPDHVRHVTACLRAGKHVICAVPAAMSIAQCEQLLAAVKQTGLSYMMAETSWYHQSVISARKWFQEGRFGRISYTEAEYHHPGLDVLFHNLDGSRTWRYGFPPMHYPTHCTAYLVGVTGERMTRVSCTGWGDDSPVLKDNAYRNPFWNGSAFYTTNRGNSFRVGVWWKAPVGGCERGQWFGEKMSFYDPHPNGLPFIIRREGKQTEKDSGGFERQLAEFEKYDQPMWWKTDMLPAPLRHDSGHEGSHTFLTHEFIDALINERKPSVNVHEAIALTAPGIIAHQSALRGGEQLKIPQFDDKG